LKEVGFIPVTIGSRILRAETAAISVISALRYGAKEF
jgi:16S rRNA U1498 N3-methylase RsmE